MATIEKFCVNLSGISCPVYSSSGNAPQIGAIEPREFFVAIGEGGTVCYLL